MVRGLVTEDGPKELFGRGPEMSHAIRRLFPQQATEAGSLLLTGESGSGRTALLRAVSEEAACRETSVLSCAGSRTERALAYGALYQILEPVLEYMSQLPVPQRSALLWAFGRQETAVGVTERELGHSRLLVGLASLNLLLASATRHPLLVVIDDLQWLDDPSLETVLFVARRIAGEPVGMLGAVRGDSAYDPRWSAFERMPVGPLSGQAAGRVLDAQPGAPRGRARRQVLRWARGNPLALVELARGSTGLGSSEPTSVNFRLPARLEAMFAERLSGLPEATRRALLFVAAADEPDMRAALSAASAPGEVAEVWAAAEAAGLVRLVSGRVEFQHPLLRPFVYGAALFAERRQAHLRLAEGLEGDPDRRAWHLAAASLAPDEAIASALVESVERARRRGGYWPAAAALERAAQLSSGGRTRARRLLDACALAMRAGEPWWVESVANEVAAATDDTDMLAEAALCRGWALAATGRQRAALSQLLPLASEMMDIAPVSALEAVAHGSAALYCSGDDAFRRQVRGLLVRIPAGTGPAYKQVWARAACDPFADRLDALALLERAADEADSDPGRLRMVGSAAWVLDETPLAVRLLSAATVHLRTLATSEPDVLLGQALALAQFDAGAWDAARASAGDARRVAEENGLETAGWAAVYVDAMVLALRGDGAGAQALIGQVTKGLDVSESRALEVRTAMVRAAVLASDGDHTGEFELLRGLFSAGAEPRPVHYHCSLYGVGDLAAAAVRVGRQQEATAVMDAVERAVEEMSPRLRLIVGRAQALLCDGEEAEGLFRRVLRDPVGEQWPFERAVVALEFGEWLRRRRRMGEARAELAKALTVFEWLRARPWMERTTGELRACRVPVRGGEADLASLGRLTPQQLQIARLAATGLTNRQIGERLLLSARTVGFHLYQVFPKLGVSSRAQLRDALGDAGQVQERTPGLVSGSRSVPGKRRVTGAGKSHLYGHLRTS